ncbi:hypothetical protein TEHN7125_2266 [Tetragenococcus halophilus subsp. halophilus]|nr:hypothetical protein TEHN7125_2266 [Tetragenococcus halophilus subsp. halophilus]
MIKNGKEGDKVTKKQVKDSLLAQLKAKGATADYFTDLVNDYMYLWDIKDMLAKDVQERGVRFKDIFSSGKEGWKNNPSNKELVMVNKQMLSLLKDLGLNEPTVDDTGGDGSDLI